MGKLIIVRKAVKYLIAILLYCYLAILFQPPALAVSTKLSTTFYQGHEVLSNRLIIRLKEGKAQVQIARINTVFALSILEKLLLDNTYIIGIPEGKIAEYINALSEEEGIEYVEPDYVVYAFEEPNDPYFGRQWGLTKIEAPEAWDLTHGSSAVKIAILDTGISKSHPDLAPKVDSWVNFVSGTDEDDHYGHGTHAAGIAAAITNNSLGVAGVAYDGRLLSVKVLNDGGSGANSWIANGIRWAAENGAKVINMSLGGYYYSQTIKDAVDYAWGEGVVIVAAAGNCGQGGPNCPGVNPVSYPAAYENVIAVAATTSSDNRASFSNYGTWIEVAAPGANIYSTYPGGYQSRSGTSMASPFVAGLAGLVFGADSSLTNNSVKTLIEENCDQISGTGTYWLNGRINALKAVEAVEVVAPTPTAVITPTVTPSPSPILTLPPTATPGVSPTITPQVSPTIVPTFSPAPPLSVPPGQACPNPCSAGKPTRRNGNANCDEVIDSRDYDIWREQFLLYQNGQALIGIQRLADFNCLPTDPSTQVVDLIDYEFWRRNALFEEEPILSPSPTPGGPTPTPRPPVSGETYYGVAFFHYGDDPNLFYLKELGLNSCLVSGGWITSDFEGNLGPLADAGCRLIVIWGPEVAPHLGFNNPLTSTEEAFLSGLEGWCAGRDDVDACAPVFMHEPKNYEQGGIITPEEQQEYYRMLKGKFPNLEFFNFIQIGLENYLKEEMCDICDIFLYPFDFDYGGIDRTIEQYRKDKAVADTVVNSNGQTVRLSLIAQPFGVAGSLPDVEEWQELACKTLALKPYNVWIGAINTGYADDNLNHEDYREVIKEITSGTGCEGY